MKLLQSLYSIHILELATAELVMPESRSFLSAPRLPRYRSWWKEVSGPEHIGLGLFNKTCHLPPFSRPTP